MKKEFNNIYIIEENDTIESIALKYGKKPIEILIYNSMTPKMVTRGNIIIIK